MRKFIALLLTLLLLTTTAFATDWAAMSTEDILSEIDQARAELAIRDLADQFVLYDSDGLTVTLTGTPTLKYGTLSFPVTGVNSSDKAITLTVDTVYINGWQVTSLGYVSLDAGKKIRTTIDVYSVKEDADLTDISQLEDVEFHMHTYDPTTYADITKDITRQVVY